MPNHMPEQQLDPDDYWEGWKRRMLNQKDNIDDGIEEHDSEYWLTHGNYGIDCNPNDKDK